MYGSYIGVGGTRSSEKKTTEKNNTKIECCQWNIKYYVVL